MEPPETLETRDSVGNSASSFSRQSAPAWKSIARTPPPERQRPTDSAGGAFGSSVGMVSTGQTSSGPGGSSVPGAGRGSIGRVGFHQASRIGAGSLKRYGWRMKQTTGISL